MSFKDLITTTERFTVENAPVILTAFGATGTVVTAYLAGNATLKSAHILEDDEFTTKEKLSYCWKFYIPATAMGSATIVSIAFANRVSSKRAAALAAAYGISERAFLEYREKVVEQIGETKEVKIRDAVAQDRVDAHPLTNNTVIIGSGDVLCFDQHSGIYFNSSVEKIRAAVNKINFDINNHGYESLSAFYDELGIPPTSHSNEVGWNSSNLMDVTISTTLTKDNKPCIAMDFSVGPINGYTNLW